MPRRVRFHGVANFPSQIPVGADCLGMLDRIKVEAHSIEFALPIDGAEVNGAPLVEPRDYRGEPLAPPLSGLPTLRWGYRSSANLYYIAAARVSFLLTPTDNTATSPEFIKLEREFLRWFDIAKHWASAWSGEPLHDIGRPQESILQILTKNNQVVGSPVRLPAVFFGARPINRAQLQSAFRRASSGDQLPAEHRLLLSAQIAQMDGDRRLAVIEAGSASEVALAAAISADLRTKRATAEFIDQAIKNANGIVGLRSLYVAIGNTLSVSGGRVITELANIRNTAVHSGRIPTDPETRRAIGHASVLVHESRPLAVI
jgi:hypothetical protein